MSTIIWIRAAFFFLILTQTINTAKSWETARSRKTEETAVLYRKYTETHYQRGYTLDEIKELLQSAGLIFREAHDMETGREVSEKSERICVIAEESGKEI